MVAEANRIINERDAVKKNKNKIKDKNGKKIIIPFSIGAALGSLAGLLWLFL